MPDDRLFHPRLLQSDKVERLTDFERGVWLVTRLVCDDFGVMRAAANTLQGAARFLEGKPTKTIHRALVALDRVGLIQTFEHEGRAYIFQWDWQDWQKVTYPRGTLHPKPPAESMAICSRSTQELFEKHPGGWGRKKQERSENVSETVPERSENVSLKPLAVSREPLAFSREPLAVDATDPTTLRVQRFIDRYRKLHQQYVGTPYLGNDRKDYEEAVVLVGAFLDDGFLDKLTVYWLNDQGKFATEGTRTVAKMRSRASKYAEELKARKLA